MVYSVAVCLRRVYLLWLLYSAYKIPARATYRNVQLPFDIRGVRSCVALVLQTPLLKNDFRLLGGVHIAKPYAERPGTYLQIYTSERLGEARNIFFCGSNRRGYTVFCIRL